MNKSTLSYYAQKALEGNSILLLFANKYKMDSVFKSEVENKDIQKVISERVWRFSSGGRILFRPIDVDINSLRGMEIDVQFVAKCL